MKSAKPWPTTGFCKNLCLPLIVTALGCLGNRRVTEDFAVLVPVELLTRPVSTLKPVWQPIRKRFITLPLQMLYQTAVCEEMWGFTTHFEGRREGTSLLIHSVTLLRWEGKHRQDTDGTGRISKQLVDTYTKKYRFRTMLAVSTLCSSIMQGNFTIRSTVHCDRKYLDHQRKVIEITRERGSKEDRGIRNSSRQKKQQEQKECFHQAIQLISRCTILLKGHNRVINNLSLLILSLTNTDSS